MTALTIAADEGATKPNVSLVFVTPDMAKRWLQANKSNRNLRRPIVDRYARDMLAGNWELTGEAIKFAIDGGLLDGQHRLSAIVKSRVTVPMHVARGIDRAAQRVMDSGAARTAADAFGIAKVPNATTVAAAARLGLSFDAGHSDLSTGSWSHAEIHEWVEANHDVHRAADIARVVARKTDITPAVVAFAYMHHARIDLEAAAQFWVAAADKVGLAAGDPVIAMTNRFAEARRNREQLTRNAALSIIHRAWNARRQGKSLRHIRLNSPAGGLVPIPEPK